MNVIFQCNVKRQSDSTIRLQVKKIYMQAERAVHRFAKPSDGSGFSMLEAVVVVGVLLALAVGGFFSYGPITKNAKIAKVKSAVSEVYTAVTVAQIDGDPTTSVISVIEAYNSSQNTIKFEIRRGENQPSIAAMSTAVVSTENYVPQSDNDFCLKATSLGDVNIFAEMGDCEPPVTAPTPTSSAVPSPTAEPTATAEPTPTQTPTPTAEPVPTPTPTPTATTPPAYVDPNPTRTSFTYRCNANVYGGALPLGGAIRGTETWSDGIVKTVNASWAPLRDFVAGVTYKVDFDGTYGSIIRNESNASIKLQPCLRSVDHLGSESGVTNMTQAFSQSPNLTSVPDRLPRTVTKMDYAFWGSAINDPNISKWDVSNIKIMDYVFGNARNFNQPLNDWNVSNVTWTGNMFNGASAFNQPLDKWKVSNVTYMSNMFNGATSFNQDISMWDTSKVAYMSYMFNGATSFNQNLSGWNTTKITTAANGANFAPKTFPTEYLPLRTTKSTT
jgi:surface protein